MLLLATLSVVAVSVSAQEPSGEQNPRKIQRLGEGPLEEEVQLDPVISNGVESGVAVEETAEERAAREQRDREEAIQRLLRAAEDAMAAGRIDQPPGDCAWFYYRSVLDTDQNNIEAQRGLQSVQKIMVDRALEFARDLDFESARRILEDAALVRQDQALIEQAEREIVDFRSQQASELEVAAVKAMDSGDFDRAERLLIELIALGDTYSTVNELRKRLEEARSYGGFKPGQTVRDHFVNQGIWTPESVILLAGSFVMGSSAFEEGREDNEGPQHRVTFRRGFALGRTEVTVKEFRLFVDQTRYRTDAEKQGYSVIYNHLSGRLVRRDGVSWKLGYDGREVSDDHPVVHVSWNDAQAYVRWLAQGTGKRYRLPSEAEFEYALRGGRTTRYWWGDGSPGRVVENLTGQNDVSPGRRQWDSYFKNYNDKHWGPAPVESFVANPFGLFDIGGNAGEWVADCWHDTYIRAPVDGSAWINPGCKLRVIRGGYWASAPDQARSAFRLSAAPDRRDARIGFRIARDL
jgi:formylglycine-generating enzyme required for sulfatase activity